MGWGGVGGGFYRRCAKVEKVWGGKVMVSTAKHLLQRRQKMKEKAKKKKTSASTAMAGENKTPIKSTLWGLTVTRAGRQRKDGCLYHPRHNRGHPAVSASDADHHVRLLACTCMHM